MLIAIVFFFSDSSYKALCISMICVVLYCTVVCRWERKSNSGKQFRKKLFISSITFILHALRN